MRAIRSLAVVVALGTISSLAVAQKPATPTSPAATMAKKPPPPPPPPDQRLPTRAPHFDASVYDRIIAPNNTVKDRFAKGLAAAQAVSARVADPKGVAQKAGLDLDAYMAAVKAMGAEKDATKRRALAADIATKFGPKLAAAREIAGLRAPPAGTTLLRGPGARRSDDTFAADLLQGDKGISQSSGGGILQQGVEGDPTRQDAAPPPPPPAWSQKTFSAPFTSAWSKNATAAHNTAPATTDGHFDNHGFTQAAGAVQVLTGITQDLAVDAAVKRVRVYAPMKGHFYTNAIGIVAYASGEAILNLRVLDGSTVLCSDRVSLSRTVAIVLGSGVDSGDFNKTLSCEAARANTGPAELTIEVDAETWVGAGGFAGADADIWSLASESPTLPKLDVILSRD